jgi:hypothetical protein
VPGFVAFVGFVLVVVAGLWWLASRNNPSW